MNLCPTVLPPRWILTILCIFAVAFLVRAEQIQFSKPVVPIAAPVKAKEKMSRDFSKSLSFSEPTVEQPYVSQPLVIRIRPREPKEDDEESDARDPREAKDPTEKYLRQGKEAKSPSSQRNAPKEPRSSEMPGSMNRG